MNEGIPILGVAGEADDRIFGRPHCEFTISGLPPSVNHCYRTDKFGRRHYKADAMNYFDEIMLAAGGIPKTKGPVRVTFAVWIKDLRRRDLDNMLKVLCDGLERTGLVEDDSQIRDMRIYEAGLDRKNPRVEVQIIGLERTR